MAKYTFLQRRHADGQQAHERMLNITIIRERQMKTAVTATPVRIAMIEKSTNNK